MKKLIFILLTLLTCCALPAYAQKIGEIVAIQGGFITGNDYLKLDKSEQV